MDDDKLIDLWNQHKAQEREFNSGRRVLVQLPESAHPLDLRVAPREAVRPEHRPERLAEVVPGTVVYDAERDARVIVRPLAKAA